MESKGQAHIARIRPETGLDAVILANDEGRRAFGEGRLEDAARAWERAVLALGPGQDRVAATAHENLGLAYFNLGRYPEAMRAFLRALDGRLEAREQSLRFLTTAAIYLARFSDGMRFLKAYEEHFTVHPEGWVQEDLERLAAEARRRRARIIPC